MATTWYSIDPTLTENGAFAALSGFENADKLTPVPLKDTTTPYDGADFSIKSEFINSRIEAETSYGSFFSGSLDTQNRLFVYEFLFYKTATATKPHGDLIQATRHGAALRIGVNLKKLDIDVSANFMAISAAVALGKAQASYKIEGISLGNALSVIAPDLPTSGNFDFEAFSKIAGLGSKIITWVNDHKVQIGSSPIQIGVETPFEDIISDASQSTYYAMRRIYQGWTLERALDKKPIHLKSDVIKQTYERVTRRQDRSYEPQEYDRSLAEAWIDFKPST